MAQARTSILKPKIQFMFLSKRYPACWPGPNLSNLTKTEAFNRPSAMALICFKVEFGGVAITSPHLNSHDPGESHGDVRKITQSLICRRDSHDIRLSILTVSSCVCWTMYLATVMFTASNVYCQAISATTISFRLFWLHRYLLRCRWHRQPWWPWWPWCSAQLCVPVSQKIKCCIFNAHQKALLDLREWLWPSLFEGFHRSAEPTSGSFDPSSVSAWLGCHVRWLQRTRKPCVVFSPIITSALWIHQISLAYIVCMYIYIILISHYITSKSGNWLVMERRSTNTNKNQLETSWITQMSAAPWEEIPCC